MPPQLQCRHDVPDAESRTGDVDSRDYYATTTLRGPSGPTLNAGIRFDTFSSSAVDEAYSSGDCPTTFITVLVDEFYNTQFPPLPAYVVCDTALRFQR
jgi:outer membrane receptor for monomeric catechols